jgi:hypothetical protein
MYNELQRPTTISATQDLIPIRAMFPLVGSHDEAIPDDFRRFRLADLMSSELVDIVLDVPFGRIKSVPIDHGLLPAAQLGQHLRKRNSLAPLALSDRFEEHSLSLFIDFEGLLSVGNDDSARGDSHDRILTRRRDAAGTAGGTPARLRLSFGG